MKTLRDFEALFELLLKNSFAPLTAPPRTPDAFILGVFSPTTNCFKVDIGAEIVALTYFKGHEEQWFVPFPLDSPLRLFKWALIGAIYEDTAPHCLHKH